MKLAVLVSGSGTLLARMIEEGLPITVVLADKPCQGLERAKAAGILTELVDRKQYGYYGGAGDNWERRAFSEEVADRLLDHGIELVAMAGFFTVLHAAFFQWFRGRITNIHPALLPNFPGEFAVRDALDSGATETGSTIIVATEKVDDSAYILAQVRVPILAGDNVDRLWERIKVEERPFYVRVLREIMSGQLKLPDVPPPPAD